MGACHPHHPMHYPGMGFIHFIHTQWYTKTMFVQPVWTVYTDRHASHGILLVCLDWWGFIAACVCRRMRLAVLYRCANVCGPTD